MHGFYSYLEDNAQPKGAGRAQAFTRCRTESRFSPSCCPEDSVTRLYVLDEPESALSFAGCLTLIAQLHELTTHGAQAVVATHSPLVAAVPGARIYELGNRGWQETPWAELSLVQNWRSFLRDPQLFVQHLVD